MNPVESSDDLMASRRSDRKSKDDIMNSRKLKERIEEFKLWTDDKTFKQMEYDKRRSRKKEMKALIRSDRRLRVCKMCYIPAACQVFIGIVFLFIGLSDGFAVNSSVWKNKIYFQIAGSALTAFGIICLMAVSFYAYKREDSVRAKHGFPSVYESASIYKASSKSVEQAFAFTSGFDDSRVNSRSRISRMASIESKASVNNNSHNISNNLGWSFSSTSTTMSWLHKHKHEHSKSSKSSLRRENNSDSALDTFFARNHILSWQAGTQMVTVKADHAGDCSNNTNSNDHSNDRSDSQMTDSTMSSGYHSNISSPTANQNPQANPFTYTSFYIGTVPERYDSCEQVQHLSHKGVYSNGNGDDKQIQLETSVKIPEQEVLLPTITIEYLE